MEAETKSPAKRYFCSLLWVRNSSTLIFGIFRTVTETQKSTTEDQFDNQDDDVPSKADQSESKAFEEPKSLPASTKALHPAIAPSSTSKNAECGDLP